MRNRNRPPDRRGGLRLAFEQQRLDFVAAFGRQQRAADDLIQRRPKNMRHVARIKVEQIGVIQDGFAK